MKKMFLIMCLMSVFTINAQDLLLFDFMDNMPVGSWPATSYPYPEVSIEMVEDPTEPDNQVVKITHVSSARTDVRGFYMDLPGSYHSSNFSGFTIRMRCDYPTLLFAYKLEGSAGMVGSWDLPVSAWPILSGTGWTVMSFPWSDAMKSHPFNRIAIDLLTHTAPLPDFVLYLDYVKLNAKNSSIDDLSNNEVPVSSRYYNLQGIETEQPVKGQTYLVKRLFESGKSDVIKQIVR